ncbi:MAG: type II toxin-antitoxin system RelE/ParE family toxin [Chloroflexota bacterium]
MSFKFQVTKRFERSVKKLKKRYPKITKDIATAFEEIENNPEAGMIIPDDFGIRKIRVASTDMKRGKSGGYRLLYKLINDDEDLFAAVLFIYAKSDQETVSDSILELLDEDTENEDD